MLLFHVHSLNGKDAFQNNLLKKIKIRIISSFTVNGILKFFVPAHFCGALHSFDRNTQFFQGN